MLSSSPRRRGSIAFWLLLALDPYAPLSSRGAAAAIQSVDVKIRIHETVDTGLRRYDDAQ